MEACAILIEAHARLLVLVREITRELFVKHVLIFQINHKLRLEITLYFIKRLMQFELLEWWLLSAA
jgi:hypothetical protein